MRVAYAGIAKPIRSGIVVDPVRGAAGPSSPCGSTQTP
jgi:hypothetical protein